MIKKYSRILIFILMGLGIFGMVVTAGDVPNWEPADWAKEAVFYEIFVRSFYDGNGDGIGDFIGLKEKIPYLKELGVNALWLMPINNSPSYHGYDVIDYYDIEPDYGTREEFIEFLEEAHASGFKVIMDLVVNHSSYQHPWFREAAKGEESQYRDYYVWKDEFDDLDQKGAWGQQVWHNEFADDYYYSTFWSGMPDLNFRNPEVREKFKDIAEFWLDPNQDGDFSDGVDGFRLDAALHIDEDLEVTHNWWQEFNTAVKSVNSEAFLVGENWTETETMAQFYEDLDSSFNFSLADKIIKMVNGVPIDILDEIEDIHSQYSQYSDDFIDATFLRNHDQNRVAYDLNEEKVKLASSLLLTLPGTPFIYYGEELGQIGAKPDDNIREPFDWYKEANGQGMTTMSKGGFYNPMRYTKANDGISLEEQRGVAGSIFEHYKKLIAIRKANPIFFRGEYQKLETPNLIYGYKVSDSTVDYNIFLIHNLSGEERSISISVNAKDLLTSSVIGKSNQIIIPAYGSLVLKTSNDRLKVSGEDIIISLPKVTFVVDLLYDIAENADLYLVSELSGWQLDDDYKLDKMADGKYRITLEQPVDMTLAFKFKTRDNWEDTSKRENDGDNHFEGGSNNNRIYTFEKEETVELTITAWE